jgi:glycosyltransferase involved in cell wall biosynthesis
VPLLQVFALAHAQRNDLTLHIVGEGELRVELEKEVKRLEIGDCVTWLGEVDDETLRNELVQAEIFLSGATHEAFGLALLEAMATGCVPVVNDIEAFRDVVAHAQNGWLTNYAHAAEAATTLVHALSQDLFIVSQVAQNKSKHYDWENVVSQFEKIYESVKTSVS